MKAKESVFDIVVVGGGPAGQKAAIQGAKAGRRVLLVEREHRVGGSCVHHGTIPSKTMREAAVSLGGFRRRTGDVFGVTVREDLQVASLLVRVDQVVRAHERYMDEQLRRNQVEIMHGKARFVSPHEIEVESIHGQQHKVSARHVVIATGSRPRTPTDVPVDHEHILDSDSILSLLYLPSSLTVLGAGVIATEYASIFATLGVKVVMIDRGHHPLGFLDPELTDRFVHAFRQSGGTFLGGQRVRSVVWDGISAVITTLESGEQIRSEKMLFALGRVANLEGLHIEAAGIKPNARGLLDVDEFCRTQVPHIYAVGDVIGPPALASSGMEQGRRAVCHMLGLKVNVALEMIPMAVYTIPEMSTVGLSESQVIERHGRAVVGRARFDEVARGQIAAIEDGLLKMVADPTGRKLLGVHIVGEGASELIHVGQMALLSGCSVDTFVENIFNFPTLAEAYRVAALDIVKRRQK